MSQSLVLHASEVWTSHTVSPLQHTLASPSTPVSPAGLGADIVCIDAEPKFRQMLSTRLACPDYRVSDYDGASSQTAFRNTGAPRVMLVGRAESDRASTWIDTLRVQAPDALVIPMIRPSLLSPGAAADWGDRSFSRAVRDCAHRIVEGVAVARSRRTWTAAPPRPADGGTVPRREDWRTPPGRDPGC